MKLNWTVSQQIICRWFQINHKMTLWFLCSVIIPLTFSQTLLSSQYINLLHIFEGFEQNNVSSLKLGITSSSVFEEEIMIDKYTI